MRNLFAETDAAVQRYKSEVADKKLLMSPAEFRIWETLGSRLVLHQYIGRPLTQATVIRQEMDRLRESDPSQGYFINIANRLYDRLYSEALLTGRVLQVGVDIRKLPPEISDEFEGFSSKRPALPYIQQGMDTLVEAEYLPPLTVSFTGHVPHETYFWATIDKSTVAQSEAVFDTMQV